MRHQDLTINHRLESWVYPNAAARMGATGFVAGDVSRIAYQSDTGQYWRLTAITPAWALIGPPTAVPPPVYASMQTQQASPAPTTSSSGVMMGLGVGHTVTPNASGKVLVAFDGAIGNTTPQKYSQATIFFGTGTPPANGAAPVGTPVGGKAICLSNLSGEIAPLCVKAVIGGLTIGVPYWFDLSILTQAGGQALIAGTTTTVAELP